MSETWLREILAALGMGAEALTRGALRIALILLAGYVAVRLLRAGLARLERLLIRAGQAAAEMPPDAVEKRVRTLVGLVRTLALVGIWAAAAIMALDQVGLAIAPLLAGAGIAGLAVGFGAQNLVRDVISGFFLVLENQVRVGDVAVVNGTGGLVESITFRTIVLRDQAGTVHVFPHGTVTTLANMTKGWSACVLDVGVAYREDTDRVVAVMEEVGRALQADPEWGPHILEPLEVLGVDAFADSAVVIRARLKTRPMQQWAAGREYRRRLKKAFDAHGIEIPFPQRVLHVGEAGRPLHVLVHPPAAGAR